jgi:hypothetical protein
VTIRPTPDDVDLLVRIIDIRDSAHLAGHTQDAFRLIEVNGPTSILVGPGHSGGIEVSDLAMGRLRDLGLFRVIDQRGNGLTFDLVDDFRDRLEEMRVAVGEPSRMGELEASLNRAEGTASAAAAALQTHEARDAEDARTRGDLRAAFAARVGRWVRWATAIVLGVLYVALVVVAGYFISANLPLALGVGIIGVSVVLAVLDWLLQIDGLWLAKRVERWAVRRVADWLGSFDPS